MLYPLNRQWPDDRDDGQKLTLILTRRLIELAKPLIFITTYRKKFSNITNIIILVNIVIFLNLVSPFF